MIDRVLMRIEELVDIIYTIDAGGFQEGYLALLDAFADFLTDMSQKGYTIDINEELHMIQQAVDKKDRVLLADLLLYQIKPAFLNLKNELL